MPQIIEEAPGFGALFGGGIGRGLGGQSQSFLSKLGAMDQQEKQRQHELEKITLQESLRGKREAEQMGMKLRGETEEKDQSKDITQKAFNRMSELIPKVGRMNAPIASVFGSEEFGEFSSLSGALESRLVDMVSRGTLSNARFKYITETLLPKPSDTQAEIRGKMKGLALELDLDPSSLGMETEKKKSKPTSDRKSLEAELKRRGLL